MKIAFGVEYDGSSFCGWQLQSSLRTVQGAVEFALSKVADQPIRVHCAGRTDSKVHARGQVLHIDTDAVRSAQSWIFGSNANLPADVSIHWSREMPVDFHARFSAIGRTYQYMIYNHATRPAILKNKVTWECRPLDHERMQLAGQSLVGEHDFSSFRAQGCQAKNPVRTVRRIVITRTDSLITIEIEANAFLQRMVRNIAGVLMAIGRGANDIPWAGELLALRNRTLGGVTAPPEGLYLMYVQYPERYRLAPPERIQLQL